MGYLINNIEDVATKIFGTDTKHLERDVYNGTPCGAWIYWDDESVSIGSIVEGSDVEFDKRFTFPFDSDEVDHWLADLGKLTTEAWREANMNELTILLRGYSYIYYTTEQESCLEAYDEFAQKCEDSGINLDNVLVEELRLCDSNNVVIDHIDYGMGQFKEGWRLS